MDNAQPFCRSSKTRRPGGARSSCCSSMTPRGQPGSDERGRSFGRRRDGDPAQGGNMNPNWFLGGMFVAIVLAWAVPGPGAHGGWLHPEALAKAGVAVVFFLHGVGLSFGALRAGVLNWRLHALVQTVTSLVFPLIGFGLSAALDGRVAPELSLGMFYLCALPSTVSSSVA